MGKDVEESDFCQAPAQSSPHQPPHLLWQCFFERQFGGAAGLVHRERRRVGSQFLATHLSGGGSVWG
jgi:hypothetical protein